MPTHLREVLEAIAWSKQGLTDEKDAVALLDLHLARVQACQPTDELGALVEVRDAALNALKNVQALIGQPLVKSHAAQLAQALDPLRRLVGKTQNADAKPKYLAEKKKLAADLLKFDALVGSGAFKGAAAAPLAAFYATYAKGRAAMNDGEKAEDYVSALELGVADVRKALNNDLREAREAYEAKYKPVKATMDEVAAAVAAGGEFGKIPGAVATDVTQAVAGLKTPASLVDGEFATAYASLATAQAAAKAFRTAAANLVLTTAKNGNERQRQQARRQADAMLKSDPNALRHMLDLDGGKEALDAMVADVGDSASNDADKAFVAGAVKARYNVDEFTGDLTTKALPRMYKVLALVPESHTVSNPKLAVIERHQRDGSSDYGGGKLTLNTGKTGRIHHNVRNFDPDEEVPKDWKVSSKNVSDFDQVTLHELGHSVDDKLGFMDGKGQGSVYGGWKMHGSADVADLAGNERGFYEAFKQFPKAMLRQALIQALDGKFPDKSFWTQEKTLADARPTRGWLLTNEVVTQAEAERERLGDDWTPMATTHKRSALNLLAGKYPPQKEVLKRVVEAILQENQPAARAVDSVLDALEVVGDAPADLVWDQMAQHEAVSWCKNIGRADVWKLGRAGAVQNADAGGVAVYVRSGNVKSTWYSYLMSARVKCVSSYQFNSPAEWFAELYAAYYMDKLPKGHPDYAWMKSEIHEAA
ncbi:MAG TPA: hypothetical protein VIN03_19620 [Roseateles sp.]